MFDPNFDDCRWQTAWMQAPLIQVMPGVYPTFRVTSWQLTETTVCEQPVRFSEPVEVRGLIDSAGTLWMSDVPQERVMMYNNAQASRGDVLVGGLGLGIYPQYAAGHVSSITVIERDAELAGVIGPTAAIAADAAGISFEVRAGSVEDALSAEPTTHYDTIFLDTWHQLDPAGLPHINRLRDLAAGHLKPDGRILLWGYAWMVRLFMEACVQLLNTPPAQRRAMLDAAARSSDAAALLGPVVERYSGPVTDMEEALAWCQAYIVQ